MGRGEDNVEQERKSREMEERGKGRADRRQRGEERRKRRRG